VRKEIQISPAYHTIYLYADESAAERYAGMADYDVILRQGFDWQPGFINFENLGEWVSFRMEVVVLNAGEEFEIHSESVRVIQLPFEVTAFGINISDCFFHEPTFIELPNGYCAIFFELMLDNRPEIINSSSYQDDIEGGLSHEFCRITLRPTDSPVEAKILKSDSNWTPPYDIGGYEPLNPPDPLVLGV
jgi:hypothetical protein